MNHSKKVRDLLNIKHPDTKILLKNFNCDSSVNIVTTDKSLDTTRFAMNLIKNLDSNGLCIYLYKSDRPFPKLKIKKGRKLLIAMCCSDFKVACSEAQFLIEHHKSLSYLIIDNFNEFDHPIEEKSNYSSLSKSLKYPMTHRFKITNPIQGIPPGTHNVLMGQSASFNKTKIVTELLKKLLLSSVSRPAGIFILQKQDNMESLQVSDPVLFTYSHNIFHISEEERDLSRLNIVKNRTGNTAFKENGEKSILFDLDP
jgi:hypothetical protein